MGADGDLYCGRCGTQYLRRSDPEHCTDCVPENREIPPGLLSAIPSGSLLWRREG